MATRLVTIFGGSGFVGSPVVQRLAAKGWRVRVAVRHPNLGQHVKPMGDVGQVQVVQADVTKPQSVALAVSGADAVVNLTGILFESGHAGFEAVHVEGARNVAAASTAAGVPTIIHVSALGARETAPSHYGRSKAAGEVAVKEAAPGATILRPGLVFGPGDGLVSKLAGLMSVLPVFAMPHLSTRIQPVYVGDVADAIVACVEGAAAGETLELAGPETFTLKEIAQFIMKETGRARPIIEVPAAAAKVEAAILTMIAKMLPIFFHAPVLTIDQVNMLASDTIATDGAKGFKALGLKPVPLAAVAPTYLVRFRKYGQFATQS